MTPTWYPEPLPRVGPFTPAEIAAAVVETNATDPWKGSLTEDDERMWRS